ncbi:hypothetical protein JXB31_00535, partial [Candidatus Woesearchaeota archaeon]|nr:hypothetical protein [Candidatus Woesearchaeota archaeon]
MSHKDDIISSIAVMIAIGKSRYTDMPYAKEIARHLYSFPDIYRPGIWFHALKWMAGFSKNTIERVTSLEGKHLSTNEAIKNLGECIVFEIAAGLSTRGLEFTSTGNSLFIEGDLENIINAKKGIVERIRKEKGYDSNPYHVFMKFDASNPMDYLKIGGYLIAKGNDKPIAIVHEGLITHLSLDGQESFRDNIKYFLEKYSP